MTTEPIRGPQEGDFRTRDIEVEANAETLSRMLNRWTGRPISRRDKRPAAGRVPNTPGRDAPRPS